MSATIHIGDSRDVLATLPEQSVQTCVTSPPYFQLRDYNVPGQIGLEDTVDEYVAALVDVFREVRRALKDDGTVWLNLGDSYAGGGTTGRNDAETIRAVDATSGRRKNALGYGDNDRGGRVKVSRTGDGLKTKDLIGIPWRVAFALQADGWYLRQDIIWHKPNPMPESVRDRCTKSHEYMFLLSKAPRYYYDAAAIAEDGVWATARADGGTNTRCGGSKYGDSDDPMHATKSGNVYEPNGKRNKRSVWTVATQPFSEAHFATFPPKLIEPCILAGSRPGDTVLDPFSGAGTTGLVADRLGRNYIGIELNAEYAEMSRKRLHDDAPMFASVEIA